MVHSLATSVLVLSIALTTTVSAQRGGGASGVTEIRVPGKRAVARVWSERASDGRLVPYFSVSADGERFTAARATDYELRLRFGRFDPRGRAAEVPAELRRSWNDTRSHHYRNRINN